MNRHDWIVVLVCGACIVAFMCLDICSGYATPIQTTLDGVEGWFLSEEEYDIVLHVMNDWEYYKDLSETFKEENDTLKKVIDTLNADLVEMEDRIKPWRTITISTWIGVGLFELGRWLALRGGEE